MSDSLLFVWVSGLVLANMILGPYPGRFWIGVLSYGAFVLVGAVRLHMIVAAQRGARRRRADREATSSSSSARTG